MTVGDVGIPAYAGRTVGAAASTVLYRYKYPVNPVYPCLNPSPQPLTPLPFARIMAVTGQSLGEAKGYGDFFDGG